MTTPEIAARRSDGERTGSRKKMIKRLLFDGVHVGSHDASVIQGIQKAAAIFAHPAFPAFSRGNEAVVAAQAASHLPIRCWFAKKRFSFLQQIDPLPLSIENRKLQA